MLRRAADTLWPNAILSNSAIILGLAKIAATDVLEKIPAKAQRKTRA